jgi:hypothetical protein
MMQALGTSHNVESEMRWVVEQTKSRPLPVEH